MFVQLQQLNAATRQARHGVGAACSSSRAPGPRMPSSNASPRNAAHEHSARAMRVEDLSRREIARPASAPRPRSAHSLALAVAARSGCCRPAPSGWRRARSNLQLLDHGFLATQGDDRSMRVVKIAAHRGAITDRNGEPLAVSTPVDSVWVNPQELARQHRSDCRSSQGAEATTSRRWPGASPAISIASFCTWCATCRRSRRRAIKALGIPGVYLLREYRRYYPAGRSVRARASASPPSMTRARKALELGFDQLAERRETARNASSRIRYGRYVENVESIRAPRPGRDLSPASICASSIWRTAN